MEMKKMEPDDQVEIIPQRRDNKKWLMSETDPLPPRPRSYWYPALFALICCCTPFGIIAIIAAYQAEDHYDQRDYASSVKLARRALCWTKLSVVFGIILIFLLLIEFIYTLQYVMKTMSEPDMFGGNNAEFPQ